MLLKDYGLPYTSLVATHLEGIPSVAPCPHMRESNANSCLAHNGFFLHDQKMNSISIEKEGEYIYIHENVYYIIKYESAVRTFIYFFLNIRHSLSLLTIALLLGPHMPHQGIAYFPFSLSFSLSSLHGFA